MEINNTMKVCTKCNRELPISEFYKNSTSKGGYDPYCKECKAAANAEAKNRSKQLRTLVKELQAENEELRRQLITKKDKDISRFEGRELLAELKRQGYVWKDMFITRAIDYDKI